jgi:hypothetical protein
MSSVPHGQSDLHIGNPASLAVRMLVITGTHTHQPLVALRANQCFQGGLRPLRSPADHRYQPKQGGTRFDSTGHIAQHRGGKSQNQLGQVITA